MNKKLFFNYKIFIRELKISDVSKKYIYWLNDVNTNKYTEQKYSKHTHTKVIKYVKEKIKSKNEFLFGIFITENKKNIHVGNIKVGPINFRHKFGEISFIIGEQSFQNRGIGTEAIKQAIKISKNRFKLKKIIAGCYSVNIASKKILLKNNFILEGKLSKKLIFKKKKNRPLNIWSKFIINYYEKVRPTIKQVYTWWSSNLQQRF